MVRSGQTSRTAPFAAGYTYTVPGGPAYAVTPFSDRSVPARRLRPRGSNARRGEPPEAAVQLAHLAEAVCGLAPLLDQHEVLLTHGNGPDGPKGVEGVVDKDLTASLLAERLKADALLLLTDVPAILQRYGTADQRPIRQATPDQLRALRLPGGSMGLKAEAACRFAERRPDGIAAIGALRDAAKLLDGRAGTCVRAARTLHDGSG